MKKLEFLTVIIVKYLEQKINTFFIKNSTVYENRKIL